MSKIVLVETVSTFRHLYAVEVPDEGEIEWALDTVTEHATGAEIGLTEFAQKHISEDVFSYREVTEEEYLKVFDEENDYLSDWDDEQKKKYIYKGEE